ncbi:hypothetical protein J6590_051040 [Homalodisca vitripennis]|nr:hypothetical protein J6590_051040 [Homalodisca vitripennis]
MYCNSTYCCLFNKYLVSHFRAIITPDILNPFNESLIIYHVTQYSKALQMQNVITVYEDAYYIIIPIYHINKVNAYYNNPTPTSSKSMLFTVKQIVTFKKLK